ncbi:MAG: hypothetical protein HY221_00115, partial [Candidatus Sungbacteria bacterium]|nr:hypothetical protein [Candidatus Sungbacteria bacterium]
MSIPGKIIELWMMGRSASSFTRLVVVMAAVSIFALITVLLFMLLAGCMLWFVYLQLTIHGMPPQNALLVLAALMLTLLITALCALIYYWRRLQAVLLHITMVQPQLLAHISTVLDAFA